MAKIPHIVILGGGFGGLSAALEIRTRLSAAQARVTVVDRKDWFMVGFAKLWIIRGTRTFEESTAPLENLSKKDIEFVKAEVLELDTIQKHVETSKGRLSYDYLIVAMGAHLAPNRIPGLAEYGFNLYDHDHLETIRKRLMGIKSGSVAIVISSMPYKCPPAPFEAAMLIDSLLNEIGSRKSISIDVYGPGPITLPAAGPEISGRVLDMIRQRDIQFYGSHKLVSVKESDIIFEDATKKFDVLLVVPPHVVPPVVSVLTDSEPFIKIDRFGRTRLHNVYAVGDITTLPGGKGPVPKAGVFAEGEGAVVARDIIAKITDGDGPEPYDGKGGCFIESGQSTASIIQVDAFKPSTTLSEPTQSNLEAKLQFEKDHLQGWLG